jgi:hypothetical protein
MSWSWADVIPPTFVVGRPLNLVVGLALTLSAVTGYFWLRRRGTLRRTAVILCLLFFAAVSLGIYFSQLHTAARQKEQWRRSEEPQQGGASQRSMKSSGPGRPEARPSRNR